MYLSDHFTLAEFTRSQTAARLGIVNEPSETVVANLKQLCDKLLEPIRRKYRKAVMVTSGYRSPTLNKQIGGSTTSSHCLGEAADIEIQDVDNYELAVWIKNNCKFDQLILEFYDAKKGPNSGWVHVSWKGKKENRNQVLTAKLENGKAAYSHGLLK